MAKDYLNKQLSFEERARLLVEEMTIEEKAQQTRYNSPANKRLGIPEYNWWNEALHGVARAGTATVFPQAIGMAATFNKELIYKAADIISTEARAKYNMQKSQQDTDIYKGLTMWSPNINSTEDLPDFCDYSMQNRTYKYFTGRVLYPFGYGLSYTRFEYTDLLVNKKEIKAGEAVKATITVKNTGNYNGYETIQVYIKNLDAPFRVPRHELIYFKKVWIPKGSQKKIAFEIAPNSFENVDENGDRKITSGRYEIYVGGGQPTYTKTQNAIIKVLNN